jgi:hypothetical protein
MISPNLRTAGIPLLMILLSVGRSVSAQGTATEMGNSTALSPREWIKDRVLGSNSASFPFSFTCDGHASRELLGLWAKEATVTRLDSARTQHTVTWTGPKTGLAVRCVAIECSDYMCPAFSICVDVRRDDVNWDLYRKLVAQCRQVAGCTLGDYYPLTPYSRELNHWIAWQFHRPKEGDGMIQAFRREECADSGIALRLYGLVSPVD